MHSRTKHAKCGTHPQREAAHGHHAYTGALFLCVPVSCRVSCVWVCLVPCTTQYAYAVYACGSQLLLIHQSARARSGELENNRTARRAMFIVIVRVALLRLTMTGDDCDDGDDRRDACENRKIDFHKRNGNAIGIAAVLRLCNQNVFWRSKRCMLIR